MPFPTAVGRALKASAIAIAVVGLPIALVDTAPAGGKAHVAPARSTLPSQIRYKDTAIDGVEVAYREAGRENAPDYPEFGHSAAPDRANFKYTSDTYAGLSEGLIEKLGFKRAEVHLLDTGHFALETHGPQIAGLIREFPGREIPSR